MGEVRHESRIKKFRKEAGLTQRELAAQTGISLRTLIRLENGEIDNPGIRTIVNLAEVLDIGFLWLIEPEWATWKEFKPGAKAPPRLKRRRDGDLVPWGRATAKRDASEEPETEGYSF